MKLLKMLLLLAVSRVHCMDRYECVDMQNVTRPLVFNSLQDYQASGVSHRSENNLVRFVTQMQRLATDALVHQESNYIRELYLDNIDLTVIDQGAFNQLYCVKILRLDHNKLFDINAETFVGLYKLQDLYLANNELTAIAASTFSPVEDILTLDLSSNNIKQLSTDSFASLQDLWELHLEHNSLTELPSDLFQPTRRLRWLFLGHNRVSVLTTPALRHLAHLDYLQLCHNGLSYIYEAVLDGMIKLEHLDLSGNRLERLNVRALHLALPVLRKLNLLDNALQCETLEPILKDLERFNIGAVVGNNVTKFKDVHPYEIGKAHNFQTRYFC